MPKYKYISNRFLTLIENLLTGGKLSEYHTGYRAFSRKLLECIDFRVNLDDFVFDNQLLLQILWMGYTIAEITCPAKYFKEASAIDFKHSIKYAFGCLWTGFLYRFAKMGVLKPQLFLSCGSARSDEKSSFSKDLTA